MVILAYILMVPSHLTWAGKPAEDAKEAMAEKKND